MLTIRVVGWDVAQLRDELDQAIGFSRVIDVLSKSRKPVIGHNSLLDFVYVFNQFYKPLPDTLAEFKQELVELFPAIYDTKHVARQSPLVEKLNYSTGLSTLFEYMREHVKPAPDSLLARDPRFDGYRAALRADGDSSDDKLLCHEAGFDAFMTGVCFVGLLAHDDKGELPDSGVVSGGLPRLTARLSEMETFKNQINLMISDEKFLDLANPTQTIDRSRVFRVASSTKRKLAQLRMEDIFEATKVQRVVREGEQDAFVVLADAAYSLSASAPADLTITPYEEFVAAQAQKVKDDKDAAELKTYERLHAEFSGQATGRAFPGLTPEARDDAAGSSWTRCTIM